MNYPARNLNIFIHSISFVHFHNSSPIHGFLQSQLNYQASNYFHSTDICLREKTLLDIPYCAIAMF